jgi:hypothetical protein
LAGSATVFALGIHLYLFQYNTWCPLPFFVLRLLPIAGNVRIPERWMAVGCVSWGVVLAYALIGLSQKKGWSLKTLSMIVIILVLFENWPGLPYRALPAVSPVYTQLRGLPDGAVLPLPLYIGDSSIGVGDAVNNGYIFPWDHLWAQVIHEKPMIGGYIGRIPRKIIDAYKADPFTKTILDLEEKKETVHPAEPAVGERALKNLGFQYVLVYPQCTNSAALHYALKSLPLDVVTKTETVELYRVRD